MTKSFKLLLTLFLLTLCSHQMDINAAPLNVTSGRVRLEGQIGLDYRIIGDRFDFFSNGNNYEHQFMFNAGETIDLSSFISNESQFVDSAMFDGIDYGFGDVIVDYTFNFQSSLLTLPPNFETAPTLNFRRPFAFVGTYTGYRLDPSGPGPQLFSVDLRGVGIAELRLNLEGPTTAQLVYQQYDFKPIPEPTTMVLLGTGLAGVGGVIRRRRASQS